MMAALVADLWQQGFDGSLGKVELLYRESDDISYATYQV